MTSPAPDPVESPTMSSPNTPVTRILRAIHDGDPHASAQLLPLVYDELRRLAAQRLTHENPGQTLQATALVHEAYLRLVGPADDARWDDRGHFFAAAAEAMRRILVEQARRRGALKRGGGAARVDLEHAEPAIEGPSEDLLALDEALARLAVSDPRKARLVELRYFAGLTMEQAAAALGIAPATAHRDWAYAKAWLHRAIRGEPPERSPS